MIEQLRFIRHLRLGDFHLLMAKTTKDIPAMMPDANCVDDQGTLSFFRTLLGKKVSNLPAQIKKSGNYSEAQNFINNIGIEALKVAMVRFKEKCENDGYSPVENRHGAEEFLDKFLRSFNIELWFNFGRQEPDFFDDLDAYGTNLITRVLLDLAASHGIREGDATFLRAFHKIMILYMLNTRDTQVMTKYKEPFFLSFINQCQKLIGK